MVASPTSTPAKGRIVGVDIARGIALVSMIMANSFAVQNDNGTPTFAAWTVTGRAAGLFVTVAGISLALMTGGHRPLRGRAFQAAAAGLAVRAFLIAVPIGLALGYADEDLSLILPYYGLLFLLAIPFLTLRPRTLACIAGALVVVGPLLLLGTFSLGLRPVFNNNIPFTAFIHPVGSFLQLLFSGEYPAAVYMVYICAGIAIGRLDLSSTKVAVWLLVGGLAMAVTAWVTSTVLLLDLGGVKHLLAAGAGQTKNDILWDPNQVSSWWWLALRAHHTGSPLDVLHTLGSGMAVLGGVLLVTKLRAARVLLWPLGVAGSMTLTLYCLHALVLNAVHFTLGSAMAVLGGVLLVTSLGAARFRLRSTLGVRWALGVAGAMILTLYCLYRLVLNVPVLNHDLVANSDWLWWGEQVAGAFLVAIFFYSLMRTGPMERIVATVSGRARRAVLARSAQAQSELRGGRPSDLVVETTMKPAEG